MTKIAEMIRRAPSFGAAVAAIRLAKRMGQQDVADLCHTTTKAVHEIERNLGLGLPGFALAFATAVGLKPDEREALDLRRASEVLIGAAQRRGECMPCGTGESGWMHVGPGERRDDCQRELQCLDFIARHFPTAERCHCPKKCTSFASKSGERLEEAVSHVRRKGAVAA